MDSSIDKWKGNSFFQKKKGFATRMPIIISPLHHIGRSVEEEIGASKCHWADSRIKFRERSERDKSLPIFK